VARDRPDLAPLIDHSLLDPHQGREAIERTCDEARHFGFAGVCVASRWLPLARERLGAATAVKLVSVLRTTRVHFESPPDTPLVQPRLIEVELAAVAVGLVGLLRGLTAMVNEPADGNEVARPLQSGRDASKKKSLPTP
jgi:hypothetical protein